MPRAWGCGSMACGRMDMQGTGERMADGCGFSRTGTSVVKGMAILMMLAHHLYGMYAVGLPEGLRYPEVVEDIAWQGKACVLMFLFVTGYGYRCAAERDALPLAEAAWRRVVAFYPLFLVALAGVVLLDACVGGIIPAGADGWRSWLGAAVGLAEVHPDYWYIGAFLVGALVFYPMLLWGMRRGRLAGRLVFAVLALLCWDEVALCHRPKVVYALLSGCLPFETVAYLNSTPLFQSLCWMSGFLVGWACAEVYLRRDAAAWCMLLLGLVVCVWGHCVYVVPFLLGLPLAKVLARRRGVAAVLGWFGGLSAVMWLTHRLIFGYWFADFFYTMPAPWNYLLLVALSALAAQLFLWGYRGAAHILANLGPRRRGQGERRPCE